MPDGNESERIRLLLVEDDQASGQALRHMLEKRGVEVVFVPSAEEALGIFADDAFSAIVADIRLTGASGVELLRRVRERSADFPVILLTGYESLETAIEALRLGAQDYILKPVDRIEDILAPVERAVQIHRLIVRNRELERERRVHGEKLRALASELLLAEEKERRRLATDVHDSIGQFLALSKLKLEGLQHAGDGPVDKDALAHVLHCMDQAIDHARSLTFQLSPPCLYEMGLEAALEDLAAQTGHLHGFDVQFHDDRSEKPLDEDTKILLFRAVRELLINTVKHAHARGARVSVSRDGDDIRIEVTDDGVGFDPGATPGGGCRGGGFGLFSIRERMLHHGGRMVVVSRPGNGTSVTLSLPLRVPPRAG